MAEDNKMMYAFAYVLGWVSGLIVYLVKKEDAVAKFHGMQSILLSVVWFVLGMVTLGFGFILFPLILLIHLFLAYKAYSGEKFMVPVLGKYAEQFSK